MTDVTQQVPDYVRQAGNAASQAANVAGRFAGGVYEIGDILKKKITEAYAANKDIVEKLDAATSEYFSSPSEARVKFENVFNPFQRENLVSQYVSNKSLPMLSQANVLGSRIGGIEGIVKSGVSGFQSLAAQKQAEADNLLDQYKMKLQEFDLLESLKQQSSEFKEKQRQFDVSTGLDRERLELEKQRLARSGSSGGTQFERQAVFAQDLASDARNGITLRDAQNKYAGKLDTDTIVKTYTANSIYGTPEEDWARKILGIYSNERDPGDL